MSFFGFGKCADIEIELDNASTQRTIDVRNENSKLQQYFLFYDGETVSGKVNITLRKPGSKFEHQGVRIELIGNIELFYDRGNQYEFLSLVQELARPGEMQKSTSYPFEFSHVEKPFESYTGVNVRLRYFLRVTCVRRISNYVREVDLIVHTLSQYPDLNDNIKMEVGIEECLHIEFEYNKSKYHLKDVIVGKIYFLLVRIKIKYMEIAIIKREISGTGPSVYNENETIAKYEIMDGAPVRGESIPIRVFLGGYELAPSMRDISRRFSVRYYLNLVLVDEEDRRYFKQQEIILWRRMDKGVLHTLGLHKHPQKMDQVSGTEKPMSSESDIFSPARSQIRHSAGAGDIGQISAELERQRVDCAAICSIQQQLADGNIGQQQTNVLPDFDICTSTEPSSVSRQQFVSSENIINKDFAKLSIQRNGSIESTPPDIISDHLDNHLTDNRYGNHGDQTSSQTGNHDNSCDEDKQYIGGKIYIDGDTENTADTVSESVSHSIAGSIDQPTTDVGECSNQCDDTLIPSADTPSPVVLTDTEEATSRIGA